MFPSPQDRKTNLSSTDIYELTDVHKYCKHEDMVSHGTHTRHFFRNSFTPLFRKIHSMMAKGQLNLE